MADAVQKHPQWPWLESVRGVGPVLAALMMAEIGDVTRFRSIPALWRYAGLAVKEGKAERRQRGVATAYNPRLKTTMYLVGTRMIMHRSSYREVYDRYRDVYDGRGWVKAHAHLAAMRQMEKRFLADLWRQGRR
ncbi:transposase [Alicyclobacillus macrosporangiidus]|uniref:Transposase IS116/IS110/IS902 family protein n=1 Tax=Alicyclobacillus macrosporangiidus TaxID=392015 RepID=A0A1I7KBT9_9BACL|nr:transposase [Alicyclobacillus macrosporangiidus]SFU94871.1 Transposase IS116/IS110/IS902 family protein [Alicyclobacillus macrosporangiidus]